MLNLRRDVPEIIADTEAPEHIIRISGRERIELSEVLVLERSAEGLIVEQEAVSKMMMFSKRVHLVLKVSEIDNVIRFEDRCGESFKRYAGSWTIGESGAGTTVTYQLTAEPTFDVPSFILKRLLRRDSRRMIELLQAEVARRVG